MREPIAGVQVLNAVGDKGGAGPLRPRVQPAVAASQRSGGLHELGHSRRQLEAVQGPGQSGEEVRDNLVKG